jgi:hypothetical protein
VTGEAQGLQEPNVLPGQIDLSLVDAMARGMGKGVVVVVPTLTKGERGNPGVVLGVVTAVVADLAPAMGGRIHQPGALINDRQAQGDPPEHQGPTTHTCGAANPVKENPKDQLQGKEPTVQPPVVGIGREIPRQGGHGGKGRNPDQHPTHVGPPKSQVAVVVVDGSIGKFVVVTMQSDPVNGAVLAAEGSAGGQDTLQPMGDLERAMAEKTVITQGDPQASSDPVQDQQGDQRLPAPEPWQQGHQGQTMDGRHVKDDAPAGPRPLARHGVQGPGAVRIQTYFGDSPGMARLGPGGDSGASEVDHKGGKGTEVRMIAVRIHIKWDTGKKSHQDVSPFRI